MTVSPPQIGLFFLSFGADVFAGMENSLYNLALGFQAHHIPVHVYSGYLSGATTDVGGVPVVRSRLLPQRLTSGDHTVRSVLSRNRPRIIAEIHEFIRARRLTHLYVCDPLWGIIQPTRAWHSIQLPMLLSLRVLNTEELLQEACAVPYRCYTAVSVSLAEQISRRVSLPNLHVVPNSINSRLYFPKHDAGPPVSDQSPIVFCNARIAPEKGIETLLVAFADVVKAVPRAVLRLCGGPYPFGEGSAYRQKIRRLIRSLGLGGSVTILPALKWSAVPDLIREATVVVLPSLSETFGRAALEAMACGRPLVVTDVGNLPNLVGHAAVIVPPGLPGPIASALIELLDNPDRRRELAAAGPEIAARYSNEQVAQEIVDLFGIEVEYAARRSATRRGRSIDRNSR